MCTFPNAPGLAFFLAPPTPSLAGLYWLAMLFVALIYVGVSVFFFAALRRRHQRSMPSRHFFAGSVLVLAGGYCLLFIAIPWNNQLLHWHGDALVRLVRHGCDTHALDVAYVQALVVVFVLFAAFVALIFGGSLCFQQAWAARRRLLSTPHSSSVQRAS